MLIFTKKNQIHLHFNNRIGKSFWGVFLFLLSSVFYSAYTQNTGAWYVENFTGATPEERHEHAFVEVNGKFYLLGGRGIKTIQEYNPVTNQWRNTATKLNNIHHFQAAVYNKRIYIIGAFTNNFPTETPVSNVFIYDPALDQLITGPLIPVNRRRGSTGMVFHNGKFYIIGGNRNGHSAFLADGTTPANVNWFDEFDPATSTWKVLPDAPRARDHFAAVVVADKLYIAGGRRSKFGAPLSTFQDTEGAVDVYDFATGQWLTGNNLPPNLPTHRAGASVAVLNKEVIVIGGEIHSNPPDNLALSVTEALNTTTGTWRTLAPMQLGRHATQAIVYQDDIYLAGGSRTRGGTEITATEKFLEVLSFDGPPYDQNNTPFPDWTTVSTTSPPRVEMVSVVYNGEIYVFNGFSPNYKIENSNYKYNPKTNVWTALATTPSQPNGSPWAVTHNGVALVGDTVWIVGGRIGNVPGPVTDRVWWYKISTNTWIEGPKLPFPAAGGGVGRLGRKLHYVGGLDENAACDVDHHLVYDLDNPAAGWQNITATAGLPEARNHAGVTVLEGKLYVIAGQNGHDGCGGGADVKFVHAYDPITNTWTRLADFPRIESHMEAGTFALDGKIYVIGGEITGRGVRQYDPVHDVWTVLTDLDLPEPLLAPVARIMGDTLIVALGGSPGTATPVSTTRMHSITRTPLHQLGFNPTQLSISLQRGETKTIETILYSQAGTAAYTINTANLPSWLSINKSSGSVKDSDEEITIRFNAANVTPGRYSYQLIATAPDYANAFINITVEVTGIQEDPTEDTTYWLESECATVGTNWIKITDPAASNNTFLTINNGYNSLNNPPADEPMHLVRFEIDVAQADDFQLFARIKAPTSKDDSFWIRVNNGTWIKWAEGLLTGNNFEWKEVINSPFSLIQGTNVIEFTYREDGAGLDKLYLTNENTPPVGSGSAASNCEIVPPPPPTQGVVSFTLVNTVTNTDIGPLVQGSVIDLSQVPAGNLNVRANTNPATVGSVVFNLSGATIYNQVESAAVYALFGNNQDKYNGGIINPGAHQLTATAYTLAGGNGAAYPALTIQFTVIPNNNNNTFQPEYEIQNALGIFQLYPNPATEQVQMQIILSQREAPLQVELLDLLGKVQQEYEWNTPSSDGTYSLSLQNLPPGLYIVRAKQGNMQQSRKLIIR